MKPHMLIFGHGYTAKVLSSRLLLQGWSVSGTTRTPEKAQVLREKGIEPLLWSDDIEIFTKSLSKASAVLLSIGPDEFGDPVYLRLKNAFQAAATHLKWVGYLSTTGVYGDFNGGWVDENTPLNPTTQRGIARKTAEEQWRSIEGLPLHIFRLAGIYGPSRGPFSKVCSGTARRIVKNGQYFSRIHVEDIVTILQASLAHPNPPSVYNVCDDDPAPPQDVIGYAAELLGQPMPPEVSFEDADLSPMARSFYAENKRVSNAKIKKELKVEIRYPSYKQGLKALLNSTAAGS